ncbi:hypothetical protein GCM10027034_37980 [Ramlibacter solisilvae]
MKATARATVKVGFDVNPDGSTTDVRILASTNVRLNGASLAAVGKWQFKPIQNRRSANVEFVFEPEH